MSKKMTKNTLSEKGKKGGMSTAMVAGATGAAIGAGIGGIAGAALSNEKTRQVVADVVTNLGEYASDSMDTVRKNSDKIGAASQKVASTTHHVSESLGKK